MERKDWRWMLPPWVVAWLLLACSAATLVLVVRCCCRCDSDAGRRATGRPEEPQPPQPMTKMRLTQPGPDEPPPPTPKPITAPQYERADSPGGAGAVRRNSLTPQVVPAGPGNAAQHEPDPAETITRSIRFSFALEGEPSRVSPWITGMNAAGSLRLIKEADVMYLRTEGDAYIVRVRLKVWNTTGTGVEPPDVVIRELAMPLGSL